MKEAQKKKNVIVDEVLSVMMKVAPNNTIGKRMYLTFSIRNNTNKPISFLTWDTPFEGLKANIFTIMTENRQLKIPYNGYYLNRGLPTEKHYITLKPNEVISTRVDIATAYMFRDKGKYYIEFAPKKIVSYIGDAKQKTVLTIAPVKIEFNITDTIVEFNKTIGYLARIKELNRFKSYTGDQLYKLSDPFMLFEGTDNERKIVADIHKLATQKIVQTVTAFMTNTVQLTLLDKWFGVGNDTDYKTNVYKMFVYLQKVFLNRKVYYDLSGGEGADENVYAYVIPGNDTIYLCQKFWEAPDLGYDSKFGTIIHELTHIHGDREDYLCYFDHDERIECSLQLAIDEPENAMDNANNFEHFTEDLDILMRSGPIV